MLTETRDKYISGHWLSEGIPVCNARWTALEEHEAIGLDVLVSGLSRWTLKSA
jgi:hypothetical protein